MSRLEPSVALAVSPHRGARGMDCRRIGDIDRRILGVEPEVKIMEITLDDTVTQEQHQVNEARRQAAIKERDTIYARCETQEKQITALLATQKQLIKLLQDAGINPSP